MHQHLWHSKFYLSLKSMNTNSNFLLFIKNVIALQNINYSWEIKNKISQVFHTGNKGGKNNFKKSLFKTLYIQVIIICINEWSFNPLLLLLSLMKKWKPSEKKKFEAQLKDIQYSTLSSPPCLVPLWIWKNLGLWKIFNKKLYVKNYAFELTVN